MLHVASQMRPEGFLQDLTVHQHGGAKSKRSVEFQRPAMAQNRPRRKVSDSEELPILLLSTPEDKQWDFGSIRHIRQASSPSSAFSPDSAVDSVFELPSTTVASPNSSVGSSFVAELEDTSQAAAFKTRGVVKQVNFSRKASIDESYIKQLQKPEFSLRAAAAIESITAIEADNRLLLERAIAAEEAAQLLLRKNEILQHRIAHYSNSRRPKTAPEKPRAVSTPAMPTSNKMNLPKNHYTPQFPQTTQFPQTPPPLGRHRPTPLKLGPTHLSPAPSNLSAPSPPRSQASNPFSADDYPTRSQPQTPTPQPRNRRPSPGAFSQPLLSPSLPHDLALKPRHHPSPSASLQPSPRPQQPRTPPVRPCRSFTRIPTIGSPIPGSVNKHTITFNGVPLSHQPAVPNISLAEAKVREAEARARQKPLPPIGPISASMVPGRVEIGDCGGEKEVGRPKEKERGGLRALWAWGVRGKGE